MVIDDQVDAIDQAAEVVRLHVDHRDAVVFLQAVDGDRLDVEVEKVDHPQVLRPGHALDGADDRRGLGAAQNVAQRQAAGHRVWIGVVVEQNQHAIGVAEVALILLDARPGQRSTELGQQRSAEQLRHREVRHVREFGVEFLGALAGRFGADAEDVDQRAAGGAHRFEHLLRAASAVVLDDDAGAGTDVRLEIRVGAARVTRRDRHPRLVEAAGERPVLDDELDLESRQQDLVEHPDDQFVLADS